MTIPQAVPDGPDAPVDVPDVFVILEAIEEVTGEPGLRVLKRITSGGLDDVPTPVLKAIGLGVMRVEGSPDATLADVSFGAALDAFHQLRAAMGEGSGNPVDPPTPTGPRTSGPGSPSPGASPPTPSGTSPAGTSPP